jgi:hypothetical protein
MGNTNSTLWPFRRAPREAQRNPAVDETLYHIDELLKVLNGAASSLPGASAVVTALQSIVGQIRVSGSFFVRSYAGIDIFHIENACE